MFFHMAVGVILEVRWLSGAALSYGLQFFSIDFWTGENFSAAKNFFWGFLRGCFSWKWGLCFLTRPYTRFFMSWHIKYRPRIFTPLFFYCWQNENFSGEYHPCPNSEPDELRDARRLPKGAAAGVPQGRGHNISPRRPWMAAELCAGRAQLGAGREYAQGRTGAWMRRLMAAAGAYSGAAVARLMSFA